MLHTHKWQSGNSWSMYVLRYWMLQTFCPLPVIRKCDQFCTVMQLSYIHRCTFGVIVQFISPVYFEWTFKVNVSTQSTHRRLLLFIWLSSSCLTKNYPTLYAMLWPVCDVIMSGHCDVILIDRYWPDWSPFGEHIPVYHIKTSHSME